MDVHQTKPTASQLVMLKKEQYLVVSDSQCFWQLIKEGENLATILEISAGKLADHEWVNDHLPFVKQLGQP
ncbi:MAG: hypothetical protein U1E05_11380, partial [Patescibacteria group bacterium]|nr:hypothetical protein [Patescibacteria group bacterium]